jgi:phosphoribosylanthranilate isomerase
MVRVKVCGITNLEDAFAAVAYGADAIGLVLAPSPRQVTVDEAGEIARQIPPFVTKVGVFVDESADDVNRIADQCGLDAVQLHGHEPEEMTARIVTTVIKAIRVSTNEPVESTAYPGCVLLLDTYVPGTPGGTGITFDWALAKDAAAHRPIVLAGGLTEDNVTSAIETVCPYAVDVSGGVEAEPGRKDHDKIARFIRAAKGLG